jgi:hypothetical protein
VHSTKRSTSNSKPGSVNRPKHSASGSLPSKTAPHNGVPQESTEINLERVHLCSLRLSVDEQTIDHRSPFDLVIVLLPLESLP